MYLIEVITCINNDSNTKRNGLPIKIDRPLNTNLNNRCDGIEGRINTINNNLNIYQQNVALNWTPDGANLEYSWATYTIPFGYVFMNAMIYDNSALKGKYLGIFTGRYDSNSNTISLYINWRYSGIWSVLISLAKAI